MIYIMYYKWYYIIIFSLLIYVPSYTFGSLWQSISSNIVENTKQEKEKELKKINEGKLFVNHDTYATNWLDRLHDGLFLSVQGQITKADTMFLKDKESAIETPFSTFEISIYAELEQGDDDFEFAIDPKLDINLDVPNLEQSLKLFINTTPLGSLPGVDPVDEERALRIGLKSTISPPESWLPKASVSIGVDGDWPPDPYAQFEIKKYINLGSLRIYPKQSFWINTSDRLSEQSTLRTTYWLAKNMVSSVWTSIKYTQDNGYFNWEQSQSVIYCLNRYDMMTTTKMHYCQLKFSMFGDNSVMKEYRLTAQYKFPIYKDWIFLEVTPELKYEKENDWEGIRVIRFGISALFWGIYYKPQ